MASGQHIPKQSAIQSNAVQCNAVQCAVPNVMQMWHDTLYWSLIHLNIRCSTKGNGVQCNVMQCLVSGQCVGRWRLVAARECVSSRITALNCVSSVFRGC